MNFKDKNGFENSILKLIYQTEYLMKNKVKIAVVGIGLMGSQHLKAINISKKAKLHSIVDINKNSIIHAKKFKVPFYQSSTELLKNKKPDAVIVALQINSMKNTL